MSETDKPEPGEHRIGQYGIVVKVASDGSGTITSNWKEACMGCDVEDCYLDCDKSTTKIRDDNHGDSLSLENNEECFERAFANAQLDTLEAFILTFVLEGGDYTSTAFQRALSGAMGACAVNANLPEKLIDKIKED